MAATRQVAAIFVYCACAAITSGTGTYIADTPQYPQL